jgi:NADH-quinone oxidoreductase subunit J
MKTLQFFFSIILILSATAIFLTDNAVYSVLLLILTFCISSVLLFSFEIEFLGLLFIMIYVGAVAVLFLFVIMMINTKKIKIKKLSTNFYILITISIILVYFFVNFVITSIFFNCDINYNATFQEPFIVDLNTLSSTEKLGQLLFNYYSSGVLIAGFILLVALIGSIYLTIDFKEIEKIDRAYKQGARNSSFTNKFN